MHKTGHVLHDVPKGTRQQAKKHRHTTGMDDDGRKETEAAFDSFGPASQAK